MIVDDHPVVRQGLKAVLSNEEDLEIVGEADDGEKAVTLARNHRPDVVVMDVAMPVCNGDKATRRILRLHPKCKVLALSSYSDDHSVQQMLSAGAVGFLAKCSASNELIGAIRTVTTSQRHFFSPAVAATARRLTRRRSNGDDQDNSLTPIEREVLKMVANGLSTKIIAQQLQLDQSDVRYCRDRVMHKLDLRGVAELTRYAITNGLVSLNRPARFPGISRTIRARVKMPPTRACTENVRNYLLEKPSYGRLTRAIEGSVYRDESSFKLRDGPFGLQQSAPDPEQGSHLTRITPRERQVATAIAEGLTNKEIAIRLMVGVRTVETHRENLMRKVKIRNVAGITKLALANGWLASLGGIRGSTAVEFG